MAEQQNLFYHRIRGLLVLGTLGLSLLWSLLYVSILFKVHYPIELIGFISLFVATAVFFLSVFRPFFKPQASQSVFKSYTAWVVMLLFAVSSVVVPVHIYFWPQILLAIYFVQLWQARDEQNVKISTKLYWMSWLALVSQLLLLLVLNIKWSWYEIVFLLLVIVSQVWILLPAARFNSKKKSFEFVVFFDGECGLCQQIVQFVMAEDLSESLQFAPLEGNFAVDSKIPSQKHLEPDLQSIVVAADGQVFMRSEAVIVLLKQLGGVWRFCSLIIKLLPKSTLEFGYRYVAQRRKIWISETASCSLLNAEQRLRVKL
jgi:predicted DCC family thiol-disulfide oxidoreductase YuxK